MASYEVIPCTYLFQEALVNPQGFLFKEASGNVYVYARLRVLVRLRVRAGGGWSLMQ